MGVLVTMHICAPLLSCNTSKPGTDAPTDSGKTDDGPVQGSGGGTGGRTDANPQKPKDPEPCFPEPIPPTVPEGWEEFPVMDCKHRIYVPSAREFLPPPLTWEPCSAKTGPLSYEYRQIKVDWPSEQPAPYALGGNHSAYVDSDGKVVIQLSKVYEIPRQFAIMAMVVEADGPVRQAFWQDYAFDSSVVVSLGDTSVASGKSSWLVGDIENGRSQRIAPFAGDDTILRPSVPFNAPGTDPVVGTVWVGSEFFAERTPSRMRVRKWDGTDMGVVVHDTPAFTTPRWIGSTMLFSLESSPSYQVLRWTEQDGTRMLVGFGDDTSKGTANPGSDGIDLVWIQGEGKGVGDEHFPVRWVMTSKFSSNPSKIQPRRLVP